ncbi:MAG: peptidoglycan-binding protein [Candidatus Pedobacter colombiensis]|uniref:Peptidoglycan-binding protein n=1 Tax=Candidatus Pedobacter colombiensis TaxID=3121371 RepID=A0AAJ5W5S6_9SPHI|nr:peptidoglycan-binding protein [Pedobacter sp.]WEK17786.1 MAG: peptidoglycan-binding protein [Pedobacter sp.]
MATINFFMGMLCLGIVSRGSMPGCNFITFDKYNYGKSRNRTAIIEIARKEIGVRESGHNSGQRISEYLNYVGFKQAAPWCAAFVSWCHKEVGLPEPRSAWSPALFPLRRLARDRLPGMVIGIYFPSINRIGHVGLIEQVHGSLIFSIEGNTNIAGSREGDAVMRKVRHKRTIAKYADWL